ESARRGAEGGEEAEPGALGVRPGAHLGIRGARSSARLGVRPGASSARPGARPGVRDTRSGGRPDARPGAYGVLGAKIRSARVLHDHAPCNLRMVTLS